MGRTLTFSEKEQRLLERIDKAKLSLNRLQNRRKIDIGELALKHGLDRFDNETLAKWFDELQTRQLSE